MCPARFEEDIMIHGWKRHDDKSFVTCTIDDPECTKWDVIGPGTPHWMGIECDSLYRAERVRDSLNRAFEAGRVARNREWRQFIEWGAP